MIIQLRAVERAHPSDLVSILPALAEAAESVLAYLKIDHAGFCITGCWANNVSAPGARHRAHCHPNNYRLPG